MDPPRGTTTKNTKSAAQASHHPNFFSATMSNERHQELEPADAETSCPNPDSLQGRKRSTRTVRKNDVLGRFSLAPATQTTVVTTTTTTTTQFPPWVIKAPRNLQNRDPKHFPLARLQTPESLKRVQFNVGDQAAFFQEADDPVGAFNELEEEQAALGESDGVLRSVAVVKPEAKKARHNPAYHNRVTGDSDEKSKSSLMKNLKRPLSPVSISITEAARIAEESGPRKRRHLTPKPVNITTTQPDHHAQELSNPRTRRSSRSTPNRTTPQSGNLISRLQAEAQLQQNSYEDESRGSQKGLFEMAAEVPSQTLSPRSEYPSARSLLQNRSSDHSSHSYISLPGNQTTEDSHLPGAVTPVGTEDDVAEQPSFGERVRHARRPRPSILDTTAAQDASLPSPSLSPVTAALNHRNRSGYFDDGVPPGRSEPALFNDTFQQVQRSFSDATVSEQLILSQDLDSTLPPPADQAFESQATHGPSTSMMSIPSMIDTFDAIPSEMQEFVMYQLLKRCSKPVLKFVADAVNPALKCDFIALLPLELSLNIISHLDVKTLCRAAQVSKKWRRIVDSDEKAWKRLFDADGYTFPDGELQRAIREGWGWQHASRPDDWEQDLAAIGNALSDTEQSTHSYQTPSACARHSNGELALPPNKRSKKKTTTRVKAKGRKREKTQELKDVGPLSGFDAVAFLDAASGSEGPYAAADAAAVAVPFSRIGLPSLRNLHLFKSIYQRHYIIRKSWMQDKTKPKHIAFRAHQRHVVTCLQFDTDKILTGSDDTNINVYDTQTGALRKKLVGHEGGVWALQYEGGVLVSGSTDRSVRVWDIEQGRCTQVFQGHTSTVRCLQILMPTEVGRTSDGRPIMMPKQPLIITGSRDSNLRVWKLPRPGEVEYFQAGPAVDDTDCPYFVRVLTGHHHSVRAIAAHADTLVSGSYDCTVRVWKISTGEMSFRLAGHTQKVYSVVLDHKRNRCISGSMDNMVKVWSLDTGSVLYNLEGHTSLVGLLDLRQDRLVSAAADSTLRIWEPETGLCKATLKAHTGAITCFQHDGQKVISGSDRTLKMWNVSTGKFVKDLLTDLSGVWQVNFNERRCVAAVQRNGLTYIEVLDFGAARDGVPESQRGHRIVVDAHGQETVDPHEAALADVDAMAED
ncbi:MAG: hypothetical protein LQ350_006837 [Teloschistes chrysophthalmus]|nr:MAG: hypothetical protein LQ350_006837 [Niorma chrysophthalma]